MPMCCCLPINIGSESLTSETLSTIMRKYLFILLFAVSNIAVFGQQYSRKTVTVGEDAFLPYIKGKVVNRIPKNDVNSQKIFIILQSQPSVNMPQGYEVEAYSDGTNGILDMYFMPYLLDEGETVRKAGGSVSFYFNNIASILGQPLQSGIGEISTAPMKIGDFIGYPIYEKEGRETTALYNGNQPLFLPISQEEYLTALIKAEEKKQKNNGSTTSASEKYEELLKKTLEEYHNRRASLSSEEASETQAEAVDSIIRNATQQALDILSKLGEDKDSFRKLGLTFEEKAFYDILMHLRDKYNFEFGEDKKVGSLIINDKCKLLAQKIKELIDVQSSFTDWLNNTNVRADLNQKIFFCLIKNGYPPQHNDEVFDQVMGQVENFKHKN